MQFRECSTAVLAVSCESLAMCCGVDFYCLEMRALVVVYSVLCCCHVLVAACKCSCCTAVVLHLASACRDLFLSCTRVDPSYSSYQATKQIFF